MGEDVAAPRLAAPGEPKSTQCPARACCSEACLLPGLEEHSDEGQGTVPNHPQACPHLAHLSLSLRSPLPPRSLFPTSVPRFSLPLLCVLVCLPAPPSRGIMRDIQNELNACLFF